MQKNGLSLYKITLQGYFVKQYDGIDANGPGEALARIFGNYERRFGMRLTIHDCRGVLYHQDGQPFFPGRHIHMHPYCITGRFETPGWNRRCHEECMLRVEAAADRLRRPFRHECWKGVAELVVPVERDGTVALLIYAGGFRTPGRPAAEGMEELFGNMPEADEARFGELAPELQLLGQGILAYTDFYRGRAGLPAERHLRIRRFLEDHAHEEVGLADLAKALNFSRNHACHLVKYHFGKPFHTLLREERIKRACNLLSGSDLPLKAVAAAVGFANEFYFSRLFTRECGVPPGEYRKRHALYSR